MRGRWARRLNWTQRDLAERAGLIRKPGVWLRRDASPDAIRAALVQFAQIEECEWVREMLAAFDYEDGLE